MAIPVFVGAGTGVTILTGSATISKTGCTGGNILVVHIWERGRTGDWSGPSAVTNLERLNGTDGAIDNFISNSGPTNSQAFLYIGRAIADGTISIDMTVGASGNDLYIRWYEFSGVSGGSTLSSVMENGAFDVTQTNGNTVTSIPDLAVTTNWSDRLACTTIAIESAQAMADFTGETGGDWTEAAEYQGNTGSTATLQLQTAPLAAAATLDGGTQTVTSTSYGIVSWAFKPAVQDLPPSRTRFIYIRKNK